MFTAGSGKDLLAMNTFVDKTAVFPLRFAAIGTEPILVGGEGFLTAWAFDRKFPEQKIETQAYCKKRSDHLKFLALREVAKFPGTAKNHPKEEGNGGDGEEFEPEVQVDIGWGGICHEVVLLHFKVVYFLRMAFSVRCRTQVKITVFFGKDNRKIIDLLCWQW
jgi:hypothetical protein